VGEVWVGASRRVDGDDMQVRHDAPARYEGQIYSGWKSTGSDSSTRTWEARRQMGDDSLGLEPVLGWVSEWVSEWVSGWWVWSL
jgi:hypothetical protein